MLGRPQGGPVHRMIDTAHRERGFTLIEIMVALVIMSILLAVGIPSMRSWMMTTRATAAAEFYAEGMRVARAEALRRNVVSRLTLTLNATSGQQDWQVDICKPTPTALCRDATGPWSTTSTPLTGNGVADFTSIFRSAKNLPQSNVMDVDILPVGADDVYFTPIGWVDGNVAGNLTAVVVAPATGNAGAFPTTRVVLTGGGSVIKCNPAATIGDKDSRKCPPT
jgi:type IV fimbrial biogenesis protein FimT